MDTSLPQRKALRLPGFDYSQAGYYFVTICTQNRAKFFGEVACEGIFVSNDFGKLVADTWLDLPNHNAHLMVDAFVVMPNHFHGIVILEDHGNVETGARAGLEPAPTKVSLLSEVVRQLKTFSARRINALRKTPGATVWQRGFYDHVIRNEDDYQRIWEYIQDNPSRWSEDTYFG